MKEYTTQELEAELERRKKTLRCRTVYFNYLPYWSKIEFSISSDVAVVNRFDFMENGRINLKMFYNELKRYKSSGYYVVALINNREKDIVRGLRFDEVLAF